MDSLGDTLAQNMLVSYREASKELLDFYELDDDQVQSVWIRGGFMNSKKILFCHGYRKHHSTRPQGEQQAYLGVLFSQWEAAVEH